jgi:hypothetical protein
MSARHFVMAVGIAATLVAPAAQAGELRLPDPNDYCTTPQVLDRLKEKVDHKFRGYTKTKNFLLEIVDPEETYSRDRDETHTVGRKWCHAKARLTDGTIRDMWYVIEKPWGFAGVPVLTSAEFCIAGLDPWKVYGKDCSTIRNAIGW